MKETSIVGGGHYRGCDQISLGHESVAAPQETPCAISVTSVCGTRFLKTGFLIISMWIILVFPE